MSCDIVPCNVVVDGDEVLEHLQRLQRAADTRRKQCHVYALPWVVGRNAEFRKLAMNRRGRNSVTVALFICRCLFIHSTSQLLSTFKNRTVMSFIVTRSALRTSVRCFTSTCVEWRR